MEEIDKILEKLEENQKQFAKQNIEVPPMKIIGKPGMWFAGTPEFDEILSQLFSDDEA